MRIKPSVYVQNRSLKYHEFDNRRSSKAKASTSSIAMMNNNGDNGSPCLTPRWHFTITTTTTTNSQVKQTILFQFVH